MPLTAVLKKAMQSDRMDNYGHSGGGCINSGQGFVTDSGHIFVKSNSKDGAKLMFDGEYESLKAMYSTNTIRVPKPIMSLENPSGGSLLVTEYIDMCGGSKYSEQLGTQLARLHLYNSEMLKDASKRASWITKRAERDFQPPEPVTKFGFHTVTCCGYLPLCNDWSESWPEFYARNRLQKQVDRLVESSGDRELLELWPRLQRAIPSLFAECGEIVPALLHGDLWAGNYSETNDGPVIFDPASFYGHSEFEFGIMTMFGSSAFGKKCTDGYHSLIPKSNGFARRLILYELFHHLNHWNHFGSGYRGSSLSLMRSLVG